MKIKFLSSIPGLAYFAGDVAELPDDSKAAELVNKGLAILIPDTEGPANQLPDDIPARDILFENGLETIEDVQHALPAITDLKGIGKAMARKIEKYFD